MKLKVAIIKGIIPSYSEGFYDRLFSRNDISVTVYCQDRIPGMNLKSIHNKYPNHVKLLKFISLSKEKLSFQFIPWKVISTEYDVIFIQGNPRNLSHLLFATFLRITKRKVVLWTMAHSFRGNPLTENIRLLWSRIFKFLLLYTDFEVSYLRQKGFTTNYMLGQNNGLDQKKIDSVINNWPDEKLKNWAVKNNVNNRTLILSCARLDPKNKFHQIVQALPAITIHFPDLLWCVIGAGTEETELKSLIHNAGLADHVQFVGELYQEDELAPWFLSSQIYVHPAAIGLSLMHAYGYGLPVITHNNSERQNPEYAAFEQNLTGLNFQEDSIYDLSEAIIKLLNDGEARFRMKNNVKRISREEYNVDVMVERFSKIAKHAYNS